MNRVVSLLLVILLLVLVVVMVDPDARQRAVALVESWEPTLERWQDTLRVNAPSLSDEDRTPAPARTPTPVPTELVDNDDEELIPTTGGDDDVDDEPIVQINWDELREELQEFWDYVRNIRIRWDTNENR